MRKIYPFLLTLTLVQISLLFTIPVSSQEQPNVRDRANSHYARYEYSYAIPLLEELTSSKRFRFSDLEKLSDSYLRVQDYRSAVKSYERLLSEDGATNEHRYQYGVALKANGDYESARTVFTEYQQSGGDPRLSSVQLAGIDSARKWTANPTSHVLINESGINTANSEFSVYQSGGQLYYTGEPVEVSGKRSTHGWTGRGYLKLQSTQESPTGRLSATTEVPSALNEGNYHVGPLSSNADGSVLYITRTHDGGHTGTEKEGHRRYRTSRLELYIYTHENGNWISTPFPYNNVKEYSLGHAVLSADESKLYYVSDMPGGQGGTDLWYSEQQSDGSWGAPQNCGAAINTFGDELFPSIGTDGALYYSTDGLAGMGGLDIFRSEGSGSSWSTPVNQGYPLNSAGDDFSYQLLSTAEGTSTGYLSSNRAGGKGLDDIYSFNYQAPKIVIDLKGQTYDKGKETKLSNTNVVLYSGTSVVGSQNSGSGSSFTFPLEANKDYTLIGSKEGYTSDTVRFSTAGITKSVTIEKDLHLQTIYVPGFTFELEDLYYDFDKDNIRPDAALVLDRLVQIMEEHKDLKIELSSHTDSRGSDKYNEALSDRRAKSAVAYLVSRGISADRMIAKGYGEYRLKNACSDGVSCSEEAHQQNRRTEVTVLENRPAGLIGR